MRRFCPTCGSEKVEFIGSSCVPCFWEDALADFPKEIYLTICRHCYSYLHGKRWVQRPDVKGEDRIIEGAVAEAEKQIELPEGVELEGITGGVSERLLDGEPCAIGLRVRLVNTASCHRKDMELMARISHELCHNCYCAATGKYDAIVQVRAEGRRLDVLDKNTVEVVMKGFFTRSEERGKAEISQVKENEGGIDIKFTELNPAKMFAKELTSITGANIIESARIVGIDKRTGGRVYRTTIAVKLPDLRTGDMLEINESIFRVSNFHRGRVVVEALSDHGPLRSVSKAQLEGARRIKSEDIKRVRMESITEKFGTFLDLDGKIFFELPARIIPRGMQPGEKGLFIIVNGKEHLVKTVEGRKSL